MRAMARRLLPPLAAAGLILLTAAPALAAPPTITGTSVSAVTTTAAILQGLVDPQGKATKYRFEYGTADCSTSTCTAVPAPEGRVPPAIKATGDLKAGEEVITNLSVTEGAFAVGDAIEAAAIPPSTTVTAVDLAAGKLEISDPATATEAGAALTATGPQSVSFRVEGLTPATAYHLRLVARSADGTTEGPDHTFATYTLPAPGLPDGRAYEQASPVAKNGIDALGTVPWVKAADDGGAVSFLTTNGVPGGVGAQELPSYLSSRGAADWSTQGLLPPASLGNSAGVIGWTPDFSHTFDLVFKYGPNDEAELLERSSADGSLRTIVPFGAGLPSGRGAGQTNFVAATPDGSKAYFESTAALLPGAVAGKSNVYLWDSETGELTNAGALEGGETPAGGAVAGSYDWQQAGTHGGPGIAGYYRQDDHAVASDGSLYFTDPGSGELYLRADPGGPDAHTVLLSASHRSEPDPLGPRPAAFMAAAPDGSKAFFTSPEELTDDAHTGPEAAVPAIVRASSATGAPEASFPQAALGVAADSERLYWVNPRQEAIGRSNLDGSDPEPTFIQIPPLKVQREGEEVEVAPKPQYVAVDAGHVYWTAEGEGEPGEGAIGRADINGTAGSVEGEWIKGATRPKGIAVNSEYVYWANAGLGTEGGRGTIGRAEKSDPSSAQEEFIEAIGTRSPQGITVDGGHLYWSVQDGDFVMASELDGANASLTFIGEDVQPHGIAVDSGHLYWTSQGEEAIGRIALSDLPEAGGFGHCAEISSCEPNFIPTEGKPVGLAADATHLRFSTNGEVQPHPGNDLYRFDRAGGTLTDLTPDPTDEDGAAVQGVLGTSADGSYVYFAANGDLDGGGPATPGDCEFRGAGAGGQPEYSGSCSLYLAHAGSVKFIARLDAGGKEEFSDAMNWLPHGGLPQQTEKAARVSPDGLTLLFRSQEKLTPYENAGAPELYRYRVGESEPTCVSCNPTGIEPSGLIPGQVNTEILIPNQPALVLSRVLSADGDRVFFESTEPLVASDTNGDAGCAAEDTTTTNRPYSCQDVYEWEAQGTGSCTEDVQGGGCLYLLSSGTSQNASFLFDASTTGNDVFLATRSELVGQDRDGLYDVYDARVGGGLAAQNPPPPPAPCEGEACKGAAAQAPGAPSPATQSFTGPANPKPKRCPAGRVRRKGRCVGPKRHHAKKAAGHGRRRTGTRGSQAK